MIGSLHSVTTGSRDRANVPLIIIIIIIMLHRHLIFSFVFLVQQTSTIITDDLYLCIELVSAAKCGHHLLIAE